MIEGTKNSRPPISCLIMMSLVASLFAPPVSAREPTEYEQYMIELINRARLDPQAEVIRLGTGDLNEGPPTLGPYPYTIPAGPKQPLAISVEVTDSASDYAQLLNETDTFCHTCLGTDSPERMSAANYVPDLSYFNFFNIAGYTLSYGGAQEPGCTGGCPTYVPGRENLSFRAEGPANGMINDLHAAVGLSHAGLFNDFTVETRGHRSTLLYGEWKEVGVGINEGTDSGGQFDSLYIVQNYAHRSDTGPFITGVAYDDQNSDGFYTPDAGEPLPGITVTAYIAGTNTVVATTTTMTAGGYNLDVGIGVYDITASGPGLTETYTNISVLGSGPGGIGENTKLDLVPVPEPALIFSIASGAGFLGLLQRRRVGLHTPKV